MISLLLAVPGTRYLVLAVDTMMYQIDAITKPCLIAICKSPSVSGLTV